MWCARVRCPPEGLGPHALTAAARPGGVAVTSAPPRPLRRYLRPAQRGPGRSMSAPRVRPVCSESNAVSAGASCGGWAAAGYVPTVRCRSPSRRSWSPEPRGPNTAAVVIRANGRRRAVANTRSLLLTNARTRGSNAQVLLLQRLEQSQLLPSGRLSTKPRVVQGGDGSRVQRSLRSNGVGRRRALGMVRRWGGGHRSPR